MSVVFHDDYSEKLQKLAFRTPVWIVDTTANRAATEGAWHEATEWPHISVTLFRFDDWPSLIRQIAFQVRGVDAIDALGTTLTLPARAALGEAGFERVDETPDGFRARRAGVPPAPIGLPARS